MEMAKNDLEWKKKNVSKFLMLQCATIKNMYMYMHGQLLATVGTLVSYLYIFAMVPQ